MNEIVEIDECTDCGRHVPRSWVPPVIVAGKPLAGTGVWQSQIEDRRCVDCEFAFKARRRRAQEGLILRTKLEELLGGPKPYREFTFDSYKVDSDNSMAFEACKRFNPAEENLYLWGSSGVGKTHLAYAIGRRCVEGALTVKILPAYRLIAYARVENPETRAAVDAWISADVLVLDGLGVESQRDIFESCDLLREILERRNCQNGGGLVVTSRYLPMSLAVNTAVEQIASRMAEICEVLRVAREEFR